MLKISALTLIYFSTFFSVCIFAMEPERNELKEIAFEDIKLGIKIKDGAAGDLYKATWCGKMIAIKALHRNEWIPSLLIDFRREAEQLMHHKHPNIVEFYAIIDESDYKAQVLEFMEKGFLYDLLVDKKQELTWDQRWDIAIGIGNGLHYLHGKKIAHGDLSSYNVLLTEDFIPKLCDFGPLGVMIPVSSAARDKDAAGTIRCRAPEALLPRWQHKAHTDIYSYGMVLWEIAARERPYNNENDEQIVIAWIKNGKQEIIPKDCPKEYGEVILETWQDAQLRPNIDEVLLLLAKAKTLQNQNDASKPGQDTDTYPGIEL
jgi:serine/threonine protein kinase